MSVRPDGPRRFSSTSRSCARNARSRAWGFPRPRPRAAAQLILDYLTPISAGTHVRFDWRVYADRQLLRILAPILRPALRANHNWAIARAIEGLEPYAGLWATQKQNYDRSRAAESGNGVGGGDVRSRNWAGLGSER